MRVKGFNASDLEDINIQDDPQVNEQEMLQEGQYQTPA